MRINILLLLVLLLLYAPASAVDNSAVHITGTVSNVTTSSVLSVPDCQDSAGNHLNYNTTTGAYSCGTTTSGAGGSGTTSTVPKFTASTTLGDSHVTDNATTVGVTGTNFDGNALTGFFKVPVQAGAAPTASGDIRYDSTQHTLVAGNATGANSGKIPRILSAQVGASDTLNCNTTSNITSSDVAFATGYTIPANVLIANKALRVDVIAELTTSGAAPTYLVKLKAGSTDIFSSSTIGPNNSLSSVGVGQSFLLQGTAAAGASVNVETGTFTPQAGATSNFMPFHTGNRTAQPIALATNGTLALTLTLRCGATTSGNTMTLRQLIVWELN